MKLIDIISEKELKEVVLNEYERKTVLYKLADERFKRNMVWIFLFLKKESGEGKGIFMGS